MNIEFEENQIKEEIEIAEEAIAAKVETKPNEHEIETKSTKTKTKSTEIETKSTESDAKSTETETKSFESDIETKPIEHNTETKPIEKPVVINLSEPCEIAKKALELNKLTTPCIKMQQTGECVAHGSNSSDDSFTVIETENDEINFINLSVSEIQTLKEQYDIDDEMADDEVFE